MSWLPETKAGREWWNKISIVQKEEILYHTLRLDLNEHGSAQCRENLKKVGQRIFDAGFQFEKNFQAVHGDNLYRKGRAKCYDSWRVQDDALVAVQARRRFVAHQVT